MNSSNDEKRDGKLLLAVVGVVVAGAAGIALLAGLSAQREAEKDRVANAPPAVDRPAPATETLIPVQASFVRPDTSVEPNVLAAEETAASLERARGEATVEAIVIDPEANLVAVALEAWDGREFSKASAYFAAQNERHPGDAWVEYMLGLSLWKDGRAAEAAATMRRSIEIEADDIKPFINLSRIENDRGEFDAALQAADDALELEANDAEALFLRARSLRNLGRVDEAVEVLETSLSLDPGNGYAHNLLGLIHIEQGRPAAAAQVLELAAQNEPDVAYIQNNLGMALELSDRPAEALAAYRRAVGLNAGQAHARLNLARLEPQTLESPVEEESVDAISESVADLGESDEEGFPADAGVQR